MFKKILGAGLTLAWMLAASACGLGGGSSSGSGDAAKVGNCDVPKSNVSAGKVTGEVTGEITFQTLNLKKDFADFFEPLIKSFEAKYPGTKVNWTDVPGSSELPAKMVATANACTLPDVINMDLGVLKALTRTGFLMDLDQKAPEAGNGFIPSIWSSIKPDPSKGHTALPWYWAPSVLTYNAELMQQAGLDPAAPPKTIEELLDQSLTIAKNSGGKFHAFLANPKPRLATEWFSMGANVVSDDRKSFVFADDVKVQGWLAKYAELYKAGAMPRDTIALDATDPSARYGEGKLVFGTSNPSFLRYVKDNSPSLYPKTMVAPYPSVAGSRFSGQYVSLPVTTKNPATAIAFAQFLLSADNQTAWCKHPKVVIFPTTTESLRDPFFTSPPGGDDAFATARKIAAETVPAAKFDPAAAVFSGPITDAINAELQKAIKGEKDPAQALKDAQAKANELLAQAG